MASYLFCWVCLAYFYRIHLAKAISYYNINPHIHLHYSNLRIAGFPFNLIIQIENAKSVLNSKFKNYLTSTPLLLLSVNPFLSQIKIIATAPIILSTEDKELDKISHRYEITAPEALSIDLHYTSQYQIQSLFCKQNFITITNLLNPEIKVTMRHMDFFIVNKNHDNYNMNFASKILNQVNQNYCLRFNLDFNSSSLTKQFNINEMNLTLNDGIIQMKGYASFFRDKPPLSQLQIHLTNYNYLVDLFIPHDFFIPKGMLKKIILENNRSNLSLDSSQAIIDLYLSHNGLYLGEYLLFAN